MHVKHGILILPSEPCPAMLAGKGAPRAGLEGCEPRQLHRDAARQAVAGERHVAQQRSVLREHQLLRVALQRARELVVLRDRLGSDASQGISR